MKVKRGHKIVVQMIEKIEVATFLKDSKPEVTRNALSIHFNHVDSKGRKLVGGMMQFDKFPAKPVMELKDWAEKAIRKESNKGG